MADFYNNIDMQGNRVTNAGDPSSASDLATRAYVDNNLAGLKWKVNVRLATTTSGTLATSFENGDTIDGFALVTGDRLLIKNQVAQSENGIYTVNASGAPTRATDADAFAELNSAVVGVAEGTANANLSFQQVNELTSLSDNQSWTAFNAGQAYTASNGLTLVGSDFRIDSSAGGNGLGFSSGVLSVNTGTASATLLEISSDNVRVSADAAGAGLTGGAGSALAVGAGTGITVNANDVAVDTSVVSRTVSADGSGTSATFAYSHNLNKSWVQPSVVRKSDNKVVNVDAVLTDANTVTFTFAASQTLSGFRFIVTG